MVGVEDLHAALDVRPVKQAGVGDQHQLDLVQSVEAAHLGCGFHDAVEVAIAGRFAVAAEGDVVEPRRAGGVSRKRSSW